MFLKGKKKPINRNSEEVIFYIQKISFTVIPHLFMPTMIYNAEVQPIYLV